MSRRQKEPLRALSDEERMTLSRLSRLRRAPAAQVARATALLAVAEGQSYTAAAKQVGRRNGDTVALWVARFNREGLAAVVPRHGGGPPVRYAAQQSTPMRSHPAPARVRQSRPEPSRTPFHAPHGAGGSASSTARNGPEPGRLAPGGGTRVTRMSPSSATRSRARCRSPRSTRPCACGSTDRAVLRVRPWSWRSTRGRLLPRSRRTRLRAEPLAGGRRTRGPVSAASRTTSPSGRPDDPPADPSP